jgi:phage recombination protein Bet
MQKVSTFPTTEQDKATQQTADQKIQKETILEYLKAFGFDKTLSDTEIQQFTQTALACNLDPFKREIYIAVYGEGENRKVSILTGYQVYLKRAERTGKLDGWLARIEGTANQMKAVVEIFRKDWSHSFIHEVYWEEAVQKRKDGSPTQFWQKQPRFQLRKVAMAQAFRLAFPDELGGLPYESAELPDTECTTQAIPHHDSDLVKTSNPDTDPVITVQMLLNNPPTANVAERSTGENFVETAVEYIKNMFEAHPEDFTEKHQAWILDKVYKATDKAGIEKMLAYTEKVVRQAA